MESSSRPQGCENCNKECTIHLTQIVNNQVVKIDLCATCPHAKKIEQDQEFGLIDKLIGKLSDMTESVAESSNLTCPACGLSERQFKKTTRLGCATCYTTFSPFLNDYLSNLHPGLSHHGKIPQRFKGKVAEKQIDALKKDMQEAVLVENYELAAELRDQIEGLKALVQKTEKID